MSKEVKKGLTIVGIVLDAAITIFLFVISVILLVKTAKVPDAWSQVALQNEKGLIPYFQRNPNVYLLVCVIPLFILLAVNIVFLVMFVKNSEKAKDVKVSDLSEEQKEALKKQLMEELKK